MSNLPIRPDLAAKKPYGAPQLNVEVKLNTNENPFSHDEAFVSQVSAKLQEVLRNANRYPDPEALELRSRLAAYLTATTATNFDANQLWAANGSNEILQQLFQLFGGPGRSAIGFEPSYSMHPIISQVSHTEWVAIERAENFDIELPADLTALKNANLVMVCSPNNPTGTLSTLDLISKLHEITTGLVVVDEAYAEFSQAKSAVTLLESHPRLAVVRTMSKAFGFAGVRLGYLVGSNDLINCIRLVRLPYHLSSLTQATAVQALEQASELSKQVEFLIAERVRIAVELQKMGFTVADSSANFLLFKGSFNQGKLWSFLVDQGVLVRDVGISGWLRVTCGTAIENDKFLAKLKIFVEQK